MSQRPLVVLDDAQTGHGLVFANPSGVVIAREPADLTQALHAMQSALASGRYLAGYFSYELGYALEPRLHHLMPSPRATPLLWFGVFEQAPAHLEGGELENFWPAEPVQATALDFEWDRETYRTRFAQAIDAIARGDIYQVNLSMRASFRLAGSARAFYRRLREHALAPHCAYIEDGERQFLSLSPELFFEVDAAGTILARPMKGTAPRDIDAVSDAVLRNGLRASVKERAENLMIVDLIRNDLGRLARTGSVAVPHLFSVETYPTVHQMVSTVTASLALPCRVDTVLNALFPCGSITGAPKIRAMEIIRGLEGSPRGVYCGAIGMFSPDGSCRFNVAIRTLTLHAGIGELGVGGAVVSDSSADTEYDECLLKARYYEAARRLLEEAPVETPAAAG